MLEELNTSSAHVDLLSKDSAVKSSPAPGDGPLTETTTHSQTSGELCCEVLQVTHYKWRYKNQSSYQGEIHKLAEWCTENSLKLSKTKKLIEQVIKTAQKIIGTHLQSISEVG